MSKLYNKRALCIYIETEHGIEYKGNGSTKILNHFCQKSKLCTTKNYVRVLRFFHKKSTKLHIPFNSQVRLNHKMLTFCDQYQGNISLDDFPSAETVDDSYRIEWIQDFSVWYKSIHGYASIVVCVLGSILNVWNLFILSKKEMRTSANIILIGLAVADLLNMIEYIPFVTYMKLWPYKSNGMSEKTYSWAVFVLVHIILSQVCLNV